jgi:alanyl-tRNA synthetase
MNGADVRKSFLEYFQSKQHRIVSSSSLVPNNDPTLLFNNAGMNQFKDCFLGADKRDYVRATTCQKCMRVSGKHNDLENIGVTARHHTFFEMLGNFSFGDYFKKDAIKFAWEYITEVLKLPKERLWVTIFENDDEAGQLWQKETSVLPGRILKLGEKDNFWAMGDTGPCGPCTEIHYYLGDDLSTQSESGFRQDDGSYLEIWNLVFMQFNRDAQGNLNPLPAPSVDTGMGLERIASILQGKKSNYDSDLLRDLIKTTERISGFTYDGSSYEVRDLKTDAAYARDVAMRVIADHSRTISFLIADGVLPSNDGRGYVLRRILRRAVRHAQALKLHKPFLSEVCDTVVATMGQAYPELIERHSLIKKIVESEEKKFLETLDSGLEVLKKEVEGLPKGALFSGNTAFLLHDTFGFPLDLTQDALKAYGVHVDIQAFEKAMSQQKARSREDRKSKGIKFSAITVKGDKSKFIGYNNIKTESNLTFAEIAQGTGEPGSIVQMFFKETPFYPEQGGQVADTGDISFIESKLEVIDTQKVGDGYIAHIAEVKEGKFETSLIGKSAVLSVDANRRARIAAHHSTTHVVHAALRDLFGEHIKQAGSKVSEESLRFDYTHFDQVTENQLREIEDYTNSYLRGAYQVETKELDIDEAKKTGAVALFGEKYGKTVRVVFMGPRSIEFCGGTHVSSLGNIGPFSIISEGSISAGTRRIECVSGDAAIELYRARENNLKQLSTLLKGDTSQLNEKIEKLLDRNRQLERELDAFKTKLAQGQASDLTNNIKKSSKGFNIIVEEVPETDSETLRTMVDRLRLKIGSGVVALATVQNQQVHLIAGVTADLTASVHAGNLIKEASALGGGRGGGRADFAQAGGIARDKLDLSLNKLRELLN